MPQHLPGMAHLPGHEFSDDFNAWCAGKGGGSEHQPDKTAQKHGKFHESSNLFESFNNADSIDYRFQIEKSLELHQQRLTTTCWAPFAILIWMRLASCIQQCFKRRILPWIEVQTIAIINCRCAISRLDLSLDAFSVQAWDSSCSTSHPAVPFPTRGGKLDAGGHGNEIRRHAFLSFQFVAN